jgi:tetratricopeptide (TPR) repeat protein
MRAQAHLAMGRHREAIADLDAAIALLDRPVPDLYAARARALVALRPPDYVNALRGLDEGLARFGPAAGLESHALDLELAQRDWNAALQRLERGTWTAHRPEWLLERRGWILAQAGDAAAARAAYAAALCEIEMLPSDRRGSAAVRELEARIRAQTSSPFPTGSAEAAAELAPPGAEPVVERGP